VAHLSLNASHKEKKNGEKKTAVLGLLEREAAERAADALVMQVSRRLSSVLLPENLAPSDRDGKSDQGPEGATAGGGTARC